MRFVTILLAIALGLRSVHAQDAAVRFGNDGRLEYGIDERGNRIPDFSHCGYQGANHPIPSIGAKVLVGPSGSDDTGRIQAAIDFVSQLKPRSNGCQ